MVSPILERNNVNVSGSGAQAIVFNHGFGCDQTMWRTIAPTFEHDYRVVLFDYVGSGLSEPEAYDPIRYSQAEGYRDDVLDVLDALYLKDVIFVGHAESSVFGMMAAIEEPERFSKLISLPPLEPTLPHENANVVFAAGTPELLPKLKVPHFTAGTLLEIRSILETYDSSASFHSLR